MKLIMAIVSNDDTNFVIKALYKEKFQATKLATTGGFLSKGNTTLIVGCEDEDVNRVIDIIGSERKLFHLPLPMKVPKSFLPQYRLQLVEPQYLCSTLNSL